MAPGPSPGFDPSFGLVDATRRMIRLCGRLSDGHAHDTAIAQTPADTIWRDGKITLSRYRPLVDTPRLGPVLAFQGLIGRQTMLDLEPGRSLVRRLLAAGVDLYALDWGSPTRADRCRDMADCAVDTLADALDAMLYASGAARGVLFGVCQGGTFAACHAALEPERVKGLALAVAPIDFHADRASATPGQLNHWLRRIPDGLIERLIAQDGNVSGTLTAHALNALAPGRWATRYTADLAEIAEDPAALQTFLRMERWLADRPDQPGALARTWLVELYRENRLVEGRFLLDGRRVDLGAIACPVLNVYARDDHIVPPPCSTALSQHLRNVAYRAVEVPTGHIGVFVSKRAQPIVAPAMVAWLQHVG
ncbi:MAG: alpha/beta fold hydrolase [Pseudomonadota bacterium]